MTRKLTNFHHQIYITSAVYQAFLHPLAKVPGPKLWAGSRLPLSWHFLKGDVWQAVSDLHLRYGPTVRIAPNELSTIVPQSWHDIYTSKPILPKDPSSQTPPLEGANSLFTAVGDEHRRLRGVFANSFSDKALRKQLPIIESYIGQLMARIGRDAKTSGGSLNIQKLYGYASFDIISELTSGEPQYSLEEGNEQSHIETFSVHAKYSTFRNVLVHFPPLDKILLSLLFSLSAKRRKENWNKGFERLTRRLQDPGPAVGSDIITSVVEKLNESKQRYITKTELLTNCLGFIIASSQLTTLVLTAMTYLLVQNPHTLTHLVMEIRNNFREERDITMASTSSLPYLEAVLKETLRIHHPTPIALPRVIPPEGRVIHGQMVPGKVSHSVDAFPVMPEEIALLTRCIDHHRHQLASHSKLSRPLA